MTFDSAEFPHHTPSATRPPPPFRLLEVTVISAQDISPAPHLAPVYALAWVDPAHKLSTRPDRLGGSHPAWNDKFLFRVDDSFLLSDTAAVTVQIREGGKRRFKCIRPDPVIGTARLVVSTLRLSSSSTRLVALQVRRPSSRPQGILNIGVALLDGAVSTIPQYYELGAPPAVALRDILSRPSISRRGRKGDRPGTLPEPIIDLAGDGEEDETSKKVEMMFSVRDVAASMSIERGGPGSASWSGEMGRDDAMMMRMDSSVSSAGPDLGGGVSRRGRRRRSLSCFCGVEMAESVRGRRALKAAAVPEDSDDDSESPTPVHVPRIGGGNLIKA